MLSLKHLVATIALATAVLVAPVAAVPLTSTHTTHTPIKHKKHRRVHRKHGHKHVGVHTKGTKGVSAHSSSFKHHPQL